MILIYPDAVHAVSVPEMLTIALKDFDLSTLTLLDIGCGEAFHTRSLSFKSKTFVDLEPRGNFPHEVIKEDALKFLNAAVSAEQKYDVVIALDFIEHLLKDDGNEFLQLLDKVTSKVSIIFTPLGEFGVHSSNEPWYPHAHWSGWTGEEFDLRGYTTSVYPGWHGVIDGVRLGVIFAYKIHSLI